MIGHFPPGFQPTNPGYDVLVKTFTDAGMGALVPMFDSLLTHPGYDVRSRDGVDWFDAPRPRRFHRCRPQSMGWTNYFTWTERCACGAIRHSGDEPWMRKNERRNGATP